MTEDRQPPKRQNYKFPLHATNIVPVNDKHFTNIMLNSKEELVSAINKLKDIDRKEIQDMTWEKYTEKRWKTILDNAIDKTIENFIPHPGGVEYTGIAIDKTMENFKSSRGGVLPI